MTAVTILIKWKTPTEGKHMQTTPRFDMADCENLHNRGLFLAAFKMHRSTLSLIFQFRIKISSVSAFINGFIFHTSSLNLNCGEKFFLNPLFSVVFSL